MGFSLPVRVSLFLCVCFLSLIWNFFGEDREGGGVGLQVRNRADKNPSQVHSNNSKKQLSNVRCA